MMEEISTLRKNDTWELVPNPRDVDLITCKWVYKLKKKTLIVEFIDTKLILLLVGSLSNMVETMMRLLVRSQGW